MAKSFSVHYPSGHKVECTSRQWAEAKHARNVDGARFFLNGSEVDATTYYAACEAGADAWFDRKCETHKKVSVQHGVLPTSRVSIWVRK
jgi:hypothetical protein